MSVKAADPSQVVHAAIRDVSQIATLPEITLRIVELVEDPSSTAQDLHTVISNDPALCSRILKVANSSFYGMPGQIGSINRAIVLLGLNAVKNIAISASLAKLFKGGRLCPAFSARDLWKHSVAAATASRMLAEAASMGLSDEAFLAGLIHDIGIMVEMQHDRGRLIEVLNSLAVNGDGVPSRDMLDAERAVFGVTHQEFGKALCERWKFPRGFAAVCGHHHDPASYRDGERHLISLVHVADRLVAGRVEGFRLDIRSNDVDPSTLDDLRLTPARLDQVAHSLPQRVEEVEALLSG